MAVKDDPNSCVKAEHARGFLKLRTPGAITNVLSNLMVRCPLRAVSLVLFNGTEAFAKHTVAHDEVDRDILHTWVSNTAAALATPDIWANKAAVLIAVRPDGAIDTATWGSTEKSCAVIARWRDIVADGFSACPFQTWFGWGNGGKPKRLTPDEYARLTPSQQVYVDRFTHPGAE